MRSSLSLVLLFVVSVASGMTQKTLDFDALSLDDGFSSSKANAIIQDRKGFIWIGTWNGLNRYDGYNCQVMMPRHHDSTAISNKEIVSLLEDHRGNIWIGTSAGLDCLDPVTGSIKSFPFPNRVISLYEDRDHFIWAGTWGSGLYRLDVTKGTTTPFLNQDIVSDMMEDSQGEFWVATYNGLINMNRQTGSFIRLYPNPVTTDGSVGNTITDIAETRDGILWIGIWDGGLNKVIRNEDKNHIRFVKYLKRNGEGSIAANDVYKLHCDERNNLWIGTWNSGLSLLEPSEHSKNPDKAYFQTFTYQLTNPYSLSSNNITSLLVDKSGILWVGSSKINRTNTLPTGLTMHNIQTLTDNQYSPNIVRSIGGNKVDRLWIGTSGEVKLYNKSGNQYRFVKDIKIKGYTYHGVEYKPTGILDILDHPSGLWIGTDDAGLLHIPLEEALHSSTPSFRYWNDHTSDRFNGNKIDQIVASKKYPNTFWIGTMYTGMNRCTFINGQLKITPITAGTNESSLSDNNIRSIIEDKDGIVWIGTQKGLNRLDPETGKIEKFRYHIHDTTSINDNIINVLYEDKLGNLWIGTNSGLNKKNERTGKTGQREITFLNFANNKHINNEVIMNILEDNHHHLWIGLYSGMAKIDSRTNEVLQTYILKDYQRVGNDRNTGFADASGNIFLGGANGYISFNADELRVESTPPVVVFTELLIYNKKVDFETLSGNKQISAKEIPYTDEIKLSYKDDVFTIVFSAMDFKSPKKNQYAYFLEGFDRKWNEAGNRTSATYTGIPPGDYILKVKACNSDGVWSEQPTELKIKITPPWWKTFPAYVFYTLVMIGLLYTFRLYSTIRLKKKNLLAIERLSFEKEHELNETKSQFFTNITHEFRTPLTLILGPTQELIDRNDLPPVVRQQSLLIQKSAQRLLRLVNQMMEFRKVENEKMQLVFQNCDIVNLLKEVCDSFTNMAESRRITLKRMQLQPSIHTFVDNDKMEQVLFNLLSNAFKFTEDGGQIMVRIDYLNERHDSYYIEVEDTGIGIPSDKKDRIFERFYQVNQKKSQSTGGIGLYLAKAFIEQHNGKILVESDPGKGSIFRVMMPVKTEIEPTEASNTPIQPKDRLISEIDSPELLPETNRKKDEHLMRSKPLVLIVEDDHDLNAFIHDSLREEFEVTSSFNGQEGLEQARRILPDLIISDVMMPGMNGFELCRNLRRDINTSHIPLIFLTAKTLKEDETEGLKLGAVDYIAKPFDVVTLKLKLRNTLQTRKNLQEKLRTQMLLEPEEIELTSLDETFLKEVVEAVTKNLDNPEFDVELLSKEMGMSSNQVYRKIKSLTGQTAKEFIRSQRLKTSASMLLQKKRSISEIIYMVGFSSPSYFARCFKEHFGCTPSEYIERNS